MNPGQSILQIMCSCGDIVSTLRVSGGIGGGTVTEPNSCWRCKAKRSGLKDTIAGEVRAARQKGKAFTHTNNKRKD